MADPPPVPLAVRLPEVYQRLSRAYGPQHWWPGEGPFEVIVGAILTQSAAWTNVEKALRNMRAAGCWSFPALHGIPQSQLAEIVHPSGYFNAKARKLKAFAAHVVEVYSGDLSAMLAQDTGVLRDDLLSIHGIGDETADDIVLYAAGKPSFVIDAYTRRIIDRMGLPPSGKRLSKVPSQPTQSYTTSTMLSSTGTAKRPAPRENPAAGTVAWPIYAPLVWAQYDAISANACRRRVTVPGRSGPVIYPGLEKGTGLSAVHVQAGASDQVGPVRCQEGHRLSNGLGPSELPGGQVSRDEVADHLGGVVLLEAVPGAAREVDGPGSHAVYQHVFRR